MIATSELHTRGRCPIFAARQLGWACVTVAALLMAGCGKKTGAPGGGSVPPPAQTAAAASPVAPAILAEWRQGDPAAAVRDFLAADWSGRPLFAADSVLSLSEAQFRALSDADRQAKSGELTAQLDSLKKLAVAVAQAGNNALAQGDAAQARKDFDALKQFGAALAGSENLLLVQLTGQAIAKKADAGLAKIQP
jgi:hypothetical protein